MGFSVKGNNCCFTTALKTFYFDMYSDVYEPIRFRLGMMMDSTEIFILIKVCIDLDLHSRSEGCKKANITVPIISQSFELIWLELWMLRRLAGLMKLMFFFFFLFF